MAWPTDSAFAAALISRDQFPVYKADVTRAGVSVLSGVPVNTGSVTVSTASPRRTCSLTVVDDAGDLVPADSNDPLAPYGNEIALARGLVTAGGFVLVPVGVFRIDKAVSSTAGGAVTIAISGSDRSARVSDDKLVDYLSIDAGTNIGTAIKSLISPSLADDQLYNFAPVTATTTAQTYAPGDDRWEKATALAEAAGCLLGFDAVGVATLRPVPDASTASPAWRFTVGPDSILTSVSNSLDRTAAANRIIVIAQGTGVDTPLTGFAQDDDPDSPTYIDGPFGHAVPPPISTSLLNTQDDVDAYAAAQLRFYAGATQQVQLSCVALPQLDAWDVIEVAVGDVALDGRYVVDQISLPLGPGTMSITTRGKVV